MSRAGGLDAPCAAPAPHCHRKASSEEPGRRSVRQDIGAKSQFGERQERTARPDPASKIRIIHIMELRNVVWRCARRQTSSAIPSNAGVTFSGSVAASAS